MFDLASRSDYFSDGHNDFRRSVRRFAERISSMELSASLGWGSEMGSLVSKKQLATVIDHVDGAVGAGATVLAGGVLSKALNSPKVARLLTEAMQTPTTSKAARPLAVRLKALLRNYGPATATGVGASRTPQEPATP